jgi:hypothetical protein
MPGRVVLSSGWRATLASLALLAVTVGCTPPPGEPIPIGANERFRGLVNGRGDGAVVNTACAGPGWIGRMGRAVGGQTVSATRDPSGPGNTGDNAAVFVEPNGYAQVVQLRAWDQTEAFPTDIDVPCDGPGVVVFDPCFGFVGCRGAAQSHRVKVTFVNLAV